MEIISYVQKISTIAYLNNLEKNKLIIIEDNKREIFWNLSQLNDEKKKKKYVLYENYVIDVSSYMKYHPGGSNMIEENLYSDMGRYLTGTQAYNKNVKPYSHNFTTIRYLLNNLNYGELKDDHRIIKISSDGNDGRLVDYTSVNINEIYPLLSARREIAENFYEYQFKFKGNFKFSRLLPKLSWMSRHFSLSSKTLNKTRYYSLCLCLDPLIYKRHIELLDNLKHLKNNKNNLLQNLILNEDELISDYLSLYIKRYKFEGTLSDNIFSFSPKNQIDLIIKGPMVYKYV
jgi:hypothetical protein